MTSSLSNNTLDSVTLECRRRTLAFWAGGLLAAFRVHTMMEITASNWTRWWGNLANYGWLHTHTRRESHVHTRSWVSTYTNIRRNNNTAVKLCMPTQAVSQTYWKMWLRDVKESWSWSPTQTWFGLGHRVVSVPWRAAVNCATKETCEPLTSAPWTVPAKTQNWLALMVLVWNDTVIITKEKESEWHIQLGKSSKKKIFFSKKTNK